MDGAGRAVEGREQGRGGDRRARMWVTPLRTTLVVVVALLLAGGVSAGRSWLESGCGHGEQGVLKQIAPHGGARMTFAEDPLKDMCTATHPTAAPSEEVLNHHAAQLAAAGWTLEGPFLAPRWNPPYLEARRGDFAVGIHVTCLDSDDNVSLHAACLDGGDMVSFHAYYDA